ncbi:unnamed protein product [Orchesella dallaii]|uniref:phospholipase A2 n=1 Tax=Orchesella dallaii TaxID=48710 RepID=A0ABP1R3X2_9HEXA
MQSFMLIRVLGFALVSAFLVTCAHGELDNWEDYPVILTMEYDKAIFLTPETGCYVVEDKRLMEKFLIRKNNVFRTNHTTAHDIIMLCKDYQADKINATQFVIGLHEKSFLIYPGTHFCGVGNNAKNDSDLGYYRETDVCCREHDSCTESVSGWSCHPTIKELCNWAPFTRSHCSCDDKFRECLQRSEESAAHTIGTLFFSVFGLKCYRKEYPATSCQEYGGFLNIHCQKYKYDYSREPIYQFFDSPKFVSETRAYNPFSNSSNFHGLDLPFDLKSTFIERNSVEGNEKSKTESCKMAKCS